MSVIQLIVYWLALSLCLWLSLLMRYICMSRRGRKIPRRNSIRLTPASSFWASLSCCFVLRFGQTDRPLNARIVSLTNTPITGSPLSIRPGLSVSVPLPSRVVGTEEEGGPSSYSLSTYAESAGKEWQTGRLLGNE